MNEEIFDYNLFSKYFKENLEFTINKIEESLIYKVSKLFNVSIDTNIIKENVLKNDVDFSYEVRNFQDKIEKNVSDFFKIKSSGTEKILMEFLEKYFSEKEGYKIIKDFDKEAFSKVLESFIKKDSKEFPLDEYVEILPVELKLNIPVSDEENDEYFENLRDIKLLVIQRSEIPPICFNCFDDDCVKEFQEKQKEYEINQEILLRKLNVKEYVFLYKYYDEGDKEWFNKHLANRCPSLKDYKGILENIKSGIFREDS